MTYATISGWGKCLPPAVLNNDDLATFLDTNDEWIYSRTGMKERRISHVDLCELGYVAAARAIACAGLEADDIDMILFGSTSFSEFAPNTASYVQKRLGASKAACMDLNTACTSFMYGLTTGTAMIKSGVFKRVLVIGGEVVSKLMDWENRNVAVLFGDGCAAMVLEATNNEEGVISETLGCYGEHRDILKVLGYGGQYANKNIMLGDVAWNFEGQDIFKRAVAGMNKASKETLEKAGCGVDDINLVVPHQANVRIIEAVGKKLGVEADKVFVNIERYGNMSAATAPIALIEAVEEGRVQPGDLVLQPAFGAGLTWSSHLIRWGQRVTPIAHSDVELSACDKTALELVNEMRSVKNAAKATRAANNHEMIAKY